MMFSLPESLSCSLSNLLLMRGSSFIIDIEKGFKLKVEIKENIVFLTIDSDLSDNEVLVLMYEESNSIKKWYPVEYINGFKTITAIWFGVNNKISHYSVMALVYLIKLANDVLNFGINWKVEKTQ